MTKDLYSWRGTKIRKGDKIGKVITDDNLGRFRFLTVLFSDGIKEKIGLNNCGPDYDYVHEFEWFDEERNEWSQF
jgi:hypothetical protein